MNVLFCNWLHSFFLLSNFLFQIIFFKSFGLCEMSQHEKFCSAFEFNTNKPTSVLRPICFCEVVFCFGLVVVVISTVTPFTYSYQTFHVAASARAPYPNFAVFWFAAMAVAVVVSVVVWLKKATMEVVMVTVLFPTGACACCCSSKSCKADCCYCTSCHNCFL
jgi:cytochrome c biogenesis factor